MQSNLGHVNAINKSSFQVNRLCPYKPFPNAVRREPNAIFSDQRPMSNTHRRTKFFDQHRHHFLATKIATRYAATPTAAICGIPQLIATCAAIMEARTDAQPLTDQA